MGDLLLAVVHRFEDRIACGGLAEFESVEVVLAVRDTVAGAHGFAGGAGCTEAKIGNLGLGEKEKLV